MSEINCNVIEDLLPLYKDDVLSEDSKKLVEGHISSCSSCMNSLERLNTEISVPAQKNNEIFKKLKSKLLRKKVIISLVSVVSAVGLIAGGLTFFTFHEIPLSYDEVKDHLIIEDIGNGNYRLYLQGLNYFGGYITSGNQQTNYKRKCIDQDMVLGFTQNIWQKYFDIGKNNLKKEMILNLYNVEDGECMDLSIEEDEPNGMEEDEINLCRYVGVYYNENIDIDGGHFFDLNFENEDTLGTLIWERTD